MSGRLQLHLQSGLPTINLLTPIRVVRITFERGPALRGSKSHCFSAVIIAMPSGPQRPRITSPRMPLRRCPDSLALAAVAAIHPARVSIAREARKRQSTRHNYYDYANKLATTPNVCRALQRLDDVTSVPA